MWRHWTFATAVLCIISTAFADPIPLDPSSFETNAQLSVDSGAVSSASAAVAINDVWVERDQFGRQARKSRSMTPSAKRYSKANIAPLDIAELSHGVAKRIEIRRI